MAPRCWQSVPIPKRGNKKVFALTQEALYYLADSSVANPVWVRPNKRIFNNAQISDHFAIIPTTTEPKNLDEMEGKVYDMIARRFVAAFFPAAEFDITTRISTVAPAHDFKTEGKVLTAPGWLAVYGRTTVDEDSADSKALPALTAEDNAQAKTISAEIHNETTKPPPRYTEATLLSAMEGAGKLVDDEEHGRGDERTRPRHAGDTRGYDRWPDQSEIHGAQSARARSDDQGGIAAPIPRRRAKRMP